MAEYFAPTIQEGFVAGPGTELNELLTVTAEKLVKTDPDVSVSLLKDMLTEERNTVEDLMTTAKKLNPVVQKVSQEENAYDAAFESEQQPEVPRAGATLQGFAILLLVISYISLTLVSVIYVNVTTGNPKTAGQILVGFIIAGLIGYTLIVRLG